MEEAMRLHKDVPFGWGLWLQEWLARRASERRSRKAAVVPRPEHLASARLKLVRAGEPALVLEGEMTVDVDGRTLAMRAGDFQFVATGRAPRAALSWPIGVRGLA